MSIETIGLTTITTSATRPRDYVNKYMARENARTDHINASVRAESRALDAKIKIQSESSADVNRINKNGQWAPEPNLSYHKSYNQGSAYYAVSQAERRIDVRA